MKDCKSPGLITGRPTRAVIDLQAISFNIAGVREKIGEKRDLMAVVKADGYGHGSVEVSRTALQSGANCLGVALPEEGQELRDSGIDVPILVLGLIQPEEASKVVHSRLEQTVCTLELAEALDQMARGVSLSVDIHVKVDTGMGRIGVAPGDVLDFVKKIKTFKNLNLKGIFSHFSCSDEADQFFAKKQIEVFGGIIREIAGSGIKIPKKHMANSGAVLSLPDAYFDLVRPGIMIYGLYPSEEVQRTVHLKPAMTFKTRVSFLKSLPAGTPISYGRTFFTEKDTLVATVPVGYGDGYSRLLSNQGHVSVRGHLAPLIGRVCMDMSMFDASGVKDIQFGDEVILFGERPSVDEIADQMQTINYEVVCLVGKRVPRVFEGA